MAEHGVQLRTGLQILNCSDAAFAALAAPPLTPRKYSQQLLGQIKNGLREFENEDEANAFIRVLDAMLYVREKAGVPVDWSRPDELRAIVSQTVTERLNADDPLVPQSWFVRFSTLNFLKQMRRGEPVTTINPERDGAAFSELALAKQAVERLKQLGTISRVELLTAPRRQSTITRSLEEIGFESAAIGGTDESAEAAA